MRLGRCSVGFLFVATMICIGQGAKVSILRPEHRASFGAKEIDIEVRIEDAAVPAEARAAVYINEHMAFEVLQPRVTARVPLPSGFHKVQAFVTNADGEKTGEASGEVHFLVDMPEEEEEEASEAERVDGSLMGMEKGRGLPPFMRTAVPFMPAMLTFMVAVSVVIASHDRFDMLMESIESVKRQTYEDWEIIVVNDASNDPRYYQLLEDVMMIHLPYNVGRPGLVRNAGLSVASGEYVAFLDDDDVWLPHKLEAQLAALARSGLNISCTDAIAGNGSYDARSDYKRWLRDYHGPYAVRNAMEGLVHFGHDFTPAVQAGHCLDAASCLPDEWDWKVLLRANFLITSSVLLRRSTLLHVGPFNNKTLGEDHDLWKKVLRLGNCAFVRSALVYWRRDSHDKLTQSNRT